MTDQVTMAVQRLSDTPDLPELIEKALAYGDVGKMPADVFAAYYKAICYSAGLNPLTRPFELIDFQGKKVLYTRKEATEQLRKVHRISTRTLSRESVDGMYIVTVLAKMPDGREEESQGVVYMENLKGDARANAMMRCETKAKRRATLAICGLGFLDMESDFTPAARSHDVPQMWQGTAQEASANLFGDDPAPLPSEAPSFLETETPEIPESEPNPEPLPLEAPNFPESEPDDIPEGEPGGEAGERELAALFVDELKDRMTARGKYSYQAVRGYVLLQYKAEPERLTHGQRARVMSWTEPERIPWLEGELAKHKGEIARVLREVARAEPVAF